MNDPGAAPVRLDVWLWRARFFKTRAMASAFISRRGVRLTRHGQTRKTNKPGAQLLPGDQLTFYHTNALKSVEFIAAGTRRGPATEAASLYRPITVEE